jgi:tetratricopeptide (TPR) repeat protein
MKHRLILLFAGLLFGLAPAHAAWFDLRLDKLTEALQILPDADRMSVSEVMALIKNGRNDEALKRLTLLNQGNPDNSSLRVLTAYSLLQLGNLVGALQQADTAHEAPNGNSYKCWFYSKLALLNGQADVCKRELAHVKKAGDLPKEVKALEKEISRKR